MPDGTSWTDGPMTHSFWCRYLEVFDTVKVVARSNPAVKVESQFQRVTGDGVKLVAIPGYVGPKEYLGRYVQVRRAVNKAVSEQDAVILRVPSNIAYLTMNSLEGG